MFPTKDSTYEEQILALTCQTMAALVAARESGDWKAVRRAARAHDGWLRESGAVPAVEQPEGRFCIWYQGHATRQKHHTR